MEYFFTLQNFHKKCCTAASVLTKTQANSVKREVSWHQWSFEFIKMSLPPFHELQKKDYAPLKVFTIEKEYLHNIDVNVFLLDKLA